MWRFESVHGFTSVGNIYQNMHFAGSNPATGQKTPNASTKFRKTSESKKAEKSLEISAFLVFSMLHLNQTRIMAGVAGFGPTNAGVKVPCLTAWLHPNIFIARTVYHKYRFIVKHFIKSEK